MTAYEKLVRHRLIDLEMSQTELARRVHEKTGLYCDQSYVARTIGKQGGSIKIRNAINEILGLKEGTA